MTGEHHGHHHDSRNFDHMGSFLLSEERRKWQDPERILELIDLPHGGTILDLGCGPGFFTVPAALRAASSATVIGIDSSMKMLSLCRERLDGAGRAGAELILMRLDELIPLADCSVDFILMANVLHDFPKPEKVLEEAARVLKHEGRIADIDWKKEHLDFGPPFEIRFSEERSRRMLSDAGFKIHQAPEVGQYHYCLIGVKQ